MANQAAHVRRRRRGQKQRHGGNIKRSPPPNPPIADGRTPLEAREEAIRTQVRIHMQKYDRVKRKITMFNRVALAVAVVCVGNNIYRRRGRGGSGASLWGEAFQNINGVHGKEQCSDRRWSLFGSAATASPSRAVPKELLRDFGSYPNILNITADMRRGFHPIVKMPLREDAGGGTCAKSESKRRSFWPWRRRNKQQITDNDSSCSESESDRRLNETYDYIIKDYRPEVKDRRVLLTNGERVPQLLPTREEAVKYAKLPKQSRKYDVGRYDEDRRGMYTSELFGKEELDNMRTIHIGVDIGAPVGTAVHAFEDGVVHSAGYNPDVGDYGHVVVIEHRLENDGEITSVYALYGHLSAKSTQGKHPGQRVRRGQTIGYLGNTAENGGWTGSHVHFQLAVNPPPTHDMPGVVSMKDREDALLEYVDPRYVLGVLY